jgi:hypothetical protein
MVNMERSDKAQAVFDCLTAHRCPCGTVLEIPIRHCGPCFWRLAGELIGKINPINRPDDGQV